LTLRNADGGKSDYRHEGKKFSNHKIFLLPAGITFWVAGPERAKNPAGKTPPPVSDPLDGVDSAKNTASLSSKKTATPTRRFNLHKRGHFSSARTGETLSAAMRVCNPDRSRVGINR